jgi:hypothetical protein
MFPTPDIKHARLAWDMAKDSLDSGDITESEFKIVREKAKERLKELGKPMKKSLGSMSYNDLRQALQNYVQVIYGKKSKHDDGYSDYPFLVDVYESEFVVEMDGKYYIADYTVKPSGDIEVGDFYDAKKIYNNTGKKADIKKKMAQNDDAIKNGG